MGTETILASISDTIAAYGMLDEGEPVLCALSGGADSTALLRALLLLGYPVRAFHLNHCLRGAEAERDEAFCRALCERLGIPLTVARVDVCAAARESGEGIEAAARRLRYEKLETAAQGSKIATAHTADDNLETMLFHLARGTGVRGLAGVPPVRGNIIRPLIMVERREVEAFLSALGQGFMTDSTNLQNEYTRNRIRHDVVPCLRGINPAAAAAAGRLCRQLRQDDAYLMDEARRLLACADLDGAAWDAALLHHAHPAVRSRALRLAADAAGVPRRDFSSAHVDALEALLQADSPSASCSLPHGFVAQREYGALLFSQPVKESEALPAVPLPVPCTGMNWRDGIRVSARILEKNEVFYKSFNTFCIDCGTISLETLCVRPRQTGDRIRQRANGGSRTLKKLFIDRKIPRAQRGRIAVIADQNGVIAVQGIGVDASRAPQGGAVVEIKIEG